MSFWAFSVAECIACCRAASSEAAAMSSTERMRWLTYIGKRVSKTSSAEGSNS